MWLNIYVCSLLIFSLFLTVDTYSQGDGTDIIGSEVPEFTGLSWLNTEPLTIKGLQGKVVLIRFWLVDCPYCYNSAPSLVEFHEKYS